MAKCLKMTSRVLIENKINVVYVLTLMHLQESERCAVHYNNIYNYG
jgi:hypothetical protein